MMIGFWVTALPLKLARTITTNDAGTLSTVALPFSFKIITAPLLESYYFESIGKRKTWIIPLQLILGGLIFTLSFSIDEFMDFPLMLKPNVNVLAAAGFIIIFLVS